jgi:hypothetical protein
MWKIEAHINKAEAVTQVFGEGQLSINLSKRFWNSLSETAKWSVYLHTSQLERNRRYSRIYRRFYFPNKMETAAEANICSALANKKFQSITFFKK